MTSDESQEKEIVEKIAIVMRDKLRLNSNKGHWKMCAITSLIRMMEREVDELKTALINGNARSAMKECADIANFAAMIFDNITPKDKKGDSGE